MTHPQTPRSAVQLCITHPQASEPAPPNAEHCEHGTRWDSVCRSCDELPAPSTAGERLTRKQVDAVVYECREDGEDTTYAIVNTAIQFYLDSAALPAPSGNSTLRSAVNAMLTQFGMDEDEWNKPTFDQARAALLQSTALPVGELPFLANGTRFKIVSDNPFDCKLYGLPKELSGRWVALVAADDDCHLAAAKAQPVREPLTVDVFYLDGHDPFICGVYGKLSLGALSEIENDIQENPDFQKGDGVYSYSVSRFEGQYGFEGRCELAPGWELCEASYTPIEAAHGIGGQK